MIPIPPHSVFSSPQFASFSLLIFDPTNHEQNAVKEEITEDDGKNRSNSRSATRFRICRGEPTLLVASANAFISEELCLVCLDELHEFLANNSQTRLDSTHDPDGGVVVDWYRSRSTGLALCYMLIQRQWLIQACIHWLHPPNSTAAINCVHSKLSSSSLHLQGLVLCVGISGPNHFFSVFVNTLPSRMSQTLSLLPSTFALPTTPIRGGTAFSQKEHIDVQTPFFGNSSSSFNKTQTGWMEALLASLVQEEDDYTNESLLVQQRRHPKDFAVSEKKGGFDNSAAGATAINCIVGADNYLTTPSSACSNRSRMEVEQMEIMGIHYTTMPKKSFMVSLAQQQEYHSPKPQSNKRSTTISIPSLHGFDYIPPEVLPPITVLTKSNSTTKENHSSYLYHNNITKDVTTAKSQKSTWNQASNGNKYPTAYNGKVSEDISSSNSTTSPASEITTPTTATTTMFHPTSSTSTTTLSNPLVEVEKENNNHKPQQNHPIHAHLNGRNHDETTAVRKENVASTKFSQLNTSITTNSTPTSSPSSSLQHHQEKENVRYNPSEENTLQTAAALTVDTNDNIPRDRKIHPEESRTDSANFSLKNTAERSNDTSPTTNENSIPITSSTPKVVDSTVEEVTLHNQVRQDVFVSASIPSSNKLSSTTSNNGLTTRIMNNEDGEASTAILPIHLNLTVSVALNEDIVCSFYNSRLLHCNVNGLIQLHVTTESAGPESSTDAPFFVVIIKDPSQQIYALKASQEYATDIGNGDDKFLYLVRNIPQDRFVPFLKYRCNDNLCPIPLRIQMKSRIVKESCRLRLSVQISSNPEMDNVLSDLDVIIMNIPSSITLDATSPKGGKFDSDQSTVSWNIPKLNAGEKIQLHAYFQSLADDEPPDLSSLPVSVRCFGLYSQLSDIQVRLRDAAAINAVDSPRLDFRMKLARRFRLMHQEQQNL